MTNFKTNIEGKDFVFEYLLSKDEVAYLVTAEGKSFEMEIDSNDQWKIVSKVPYALLKLESKFDMAIEAANL
jgi:hypothetical protein